MTWLLQFEVCTMRTSSAPASRNSCMASAPVEVTALTGGPGENPIGKTLVPLTTRARSALTVTTEPVWARRHERLVQRRNKARVSLWRGEEDLGINGWDWLAGCVVGSGS